MWWQQVAISLTTKRLLNSSKSTNWMRWEKLHKSEILPAGHSKWANIRHIKALKDGQKSAMFTKYSRQIRLAVQEGGSGDIALNSQLRNVVEEALRKNMPMATIQNSIKKSTQSKTLLRKHYLYWRFQQKVFAVCVLYTENFPQLKMEIAPILRKSGAVYVDGQHLFDDVGIIEAVANDPAKFKCKAIEDLEQICTDDAIECGVEEVEVVDFENRTVNFMCNPIELSTIGRLLESKGYTIESSQHVFVPKTTVTISDSDLKMYRNFREKIFNISGIEEIYDNLEMNVN